MKDDKARVASVHVTKVADDVRVTVHDDGEGGVDPSQGTGIAGIRARVNAVDGAIANWAMRFGSCRPAYVKPYVRRQNDLADAAAICEAVTRPSMRFMPIRAKRSRRCC